MNYESTRCSTQKVTAATAIVEGLSHDGGLFVPVSIPTISLEEIEKLGSLPYCKQAFEIFKLFLTDFTDEELQEATEKAYSDNFENESIIEISHLLNGKYMLELWHGPTCAFKDMALQVLPYLLSTAAKKTLPNKKIAILTATSGDTGKAALEGFKDVPGIKINVFFPVNGVSPMQKRQMTTQEGNNVNVIAVEGNFDDCQNGVKEIFTNAGMISKLDELGYSFSSANSINWGRLCPQIVYYISAYSELVKNGDLQLGELINVVVPTGNFGNILAAYYAKQMGLPINKLICASNANNVLTDFINTGIYNKNRKFITTLSPSMDILISSNLERLLYHLNGNNDTIIKELFSSLAQTGEYEVNNEVKLILHNLFYAGFCDDKATKEAIKSVFDDYSYLMDTHTAVAFKVYEDYKKSTADETKTIIVSTASPYKFSTAVYESLSEKVPDTDEFEIVENISKMSKTNIPAPLLATKDKVVRFDKTITKSEMSSDVLDFLKGMGD